MSFQVRHLGFAHRTHAILHDVTFDVQTGEILGILGPNGSGKSSLLRLMAGSRRPATGRVTLEGVAVADMPRRQLAGRLAVVAQKSETSLRMAAVDVVRLGRLPRRGPFTAWTAGDEAAVSDALERVGMTAHRHQDWHTLSGGEQQRIQIARALAQDPQEILLDEPTNHLDIAHQFDLLRLLATLRLTTVIALHDLNHAAMFCHRILVMEGGRIAAIGPPADVLTAELIRRVFRVRAGVEIVEGCPRITYYP
ncbi:ABC transporter ATP-binding protein [Falsirhodobacter halotolerans]|uniref:ABC transporter ATP-binding protein n=1 Tax=Falsirhodobacter halotolerans TaxID=1146892 RepID=UPI001FD294E2|nr:ABC transporter ATP-binding protein [Falsirhodobacter halotolerans]MCJ8139265.1 ABC transporter ATP-binding protein [Falsirhodobacter halotolerans]